MASLSIVTPTFNRATLLPRCYASLQKQTSYDFEWIIVDDGSTDNTAEVAAQFSDKQFPITFVRKVNGGKHTALNASHPYIQGEYVLILDSDDYLTETAVEETLKAWERYADWEQIGIVTFLKKTEDGVPFCTVRDYETPVSIMRNRRIRVVGNDCCEVIRTSLFLQYPFPEFYGERFLAESALWERVGFTHRTVYINSMIYVCEYLEDGLTKAGRTLRLKNPKGGMYVAELRMDSGNDLKDRMKNALLYNCYGSLANVSAADRIKRSRAPLLAGICLIPGVFLSFYWKRKYGKQ